MASGLPVYSGDTGTKGVKTLSGQSNMAKIPEGADMLIYDAAVMEKPGQSLDM